MRCRAVVLDEMGRPQPYAASRPLTVAEVEVDPPGEGEVLVRIRAAGLCHSDLSVINGDRPRPLPMALGHEAAGEVVEVGPGVEDLQPGDHVVAAFVPCCRACEPCASGRPALCEPGLAANTAGTLLSGALYQLGLRYGPSGGLIACLWASAALLLAASLLSRLLPADTGPRTRPIKLKDLGE